MTEKPANNLVASIRQRLLNVSKERGEDPNLIFIRYVIERILYRISRSKESNQFILKGAMLITTWTGQPHRPTKDLDLLGFGDHSSERIRQIFHDICEEEVEPDGLEFNTERIQVTEIREDLTYPGQRVKLEARLGTACIYVQIDIGFGDTVVPEAIEIEYPTLLDLPAPHILAYPPETVVAEKYESIVDLGILNSRMKDYYDLRMMAKDFRFDGNSLVKAIKATFNNRNTDIPLETPLSLTEEFFSNQDKITQWKAFLKRSKLDDVSVDLSQVIDELCKFLLPPTIAVANNIAFNQVWTDGGPWIEKL
jgi:predicted nucleotidyltransferase component of viral defense system